jgi:hypothetical protein
MGAGTLVQQTKMDDRSQGSNGQKVKSCIVLFTLPIHAVKAQLPPP